MKNSIAIDKVDEAFAGFPVVLASVAGSRDNVITLAMCHVFSFKPPLIGVGIAPRRFSYGLFKESKDFAVNIPDKTMLRAVQICGSRSGRDVDKFSASGLTKEKAEKIASPLIAECPVNIECIKVKEAEAGDHTWFIGEIVAARGSPEYRRSDMILFWNDYRVIGDLVK